MVKHGTIDRAPTKPPGGSSRRGMYRSRSKSRSRTPTTPTIPSHRRAATTASQVAHKPRHHHHHHNAPLERDVLEVLAHPAVDAGEIEGGVVLRLRSRCERHGPRVVKRPCGRRNRDLVPTSLRNEERRQRRTHTHARTHARTHAQTHTRTHTGTHTRTHAQHRA
jgi:hypothetical protein